MLDQELHRQHPHYAAEWGWIVDQPHSVLLEGFDPTGRPVIVDPANGREHWNRQGLSDLWTGRVVWIEADPEFD